MRFLNLNKGFPTPGRNLAMRLLTEIMTESKKNLSKREDRSNEPLAPGVHGLRAFLGGGLPARWPSSSRCCRRRPGRRRETWEVATQ